MTTLKSPVFAQAKMAPKIQKKYLQIDNRMKNIQIVYENEEILLINKEAEMSSVPSRSTSSSNRIRGEN